MYKVKINNHDLFEIDHKISSIINTNDDVLIKALPNGSFNILINGLMQNADVLGWDEDSKIAKIKINQNVYEAVVKEPSDLLLEKLGMTIAKPKKANNLISPMPGLILKILVTKGQIVKKGESLLLLEAMKMENVFKASADCIVKEINIQEKQAVEKGQELIVFAQQ
jgi:biotin carboxyl carrier protein